MSAFIVVPMPLLLGAGLVVQILILEVVLLIDIILHVVCLLIR